ncbi:MAG: CadC-family transcriptional regulator [Acidobacteria bacterium]|nr:MAG: CadC-family transcriptional regulator [Acidobacteriota bacterium]
MSAEPTGFGRFRLDVDRRELFRDGVRVQLGSRALDILCVLASAKGAIVSKDELMRRVWPDVVVEEGNIQVQVSALRKTLEDGKDAQTYVVTVPGRGYRLVGLQSVPPVGRSSDSEKPLTVPDKPSVAILPFTNLSGDPEQEYFAEGIVEEITAALSRIRWLFVIARNSSFMFKGRAVDVKEIGRELGVRYVLEGSIRKASNRVRVTGQLIDASSGAHLWADRFDGSLEDVFELQDEITAKVIGAIAPKMEQAEMERAKRKPTGSLDAYDYYLRGLASTYLGTKEAIAEALSLFNRAIEHDPDFGAAHGMAAWCHLWRHVNGWTSDRSEEEAETQYLVRRAALIGKDDAVALCFGGLVLAFVTGDCEGGIALIDRALALNPNLAAAWNASGWVRAFLGETDVAIEHIQRATRLSPLDPLMFVMHHVTGLAHFVAGRYREAALSAGKALREQPNFLASVRLSAVSHALSGHLDQARNCVVRARELDPAMRLSNLKDRVGPFRPEDFSKYREALQIAGLPE